MAECIVCEHRNEVHGQPLMAPALSVNWPFSQLRANECVRRWSVRSSLCSE